MSVSLATLTARLVAAVPTVSGVPSAAQFQQCVEDAVADLGARKPNQKVHTLNVVPGMGEYALPRDFVRVIEIELPLITQGVLISDTGLIPVGAEWAELYTVAGQMLAITPTPMYAAGRRLWYAAGHVLDAAEVYPDLTAADAALVLLKAAAFAFDMLALAAGPAGWRYEIGDEMVDKSGLAKGYRSQIEALEERYERGLAAANRVFGVRGGVHGGM